MRVLPCGDAAVLVEIDGPVGSDAPQHAERSTESILAAVRALSTAIRRDPPSGLVDIVPAERTVLVRVTPGTDLGALERDLLTRKPASDEPETTAETVHVPVVYDGADLAQVAHDTGLTVDDVLAAHTGTAWTVAFCGFAPGFAYLIGADPRLVVPRRASPRARVPRGSVALAGRYSAVYPGDSPGGWALIGRTELAVWDLERDPPALLRPGVRVIFDRADA